MPIGMESSSENALAPDTPMHAESNGVKKQRRRHPKKPKDILDEPRRESSRPIRQKVQSAETESVSNEKENVKEKSCGNDSEYDEADEEVEDILERVTYEDGNVYFRIRWKGYGPEDDTWEPKKNLDCPKLIEEFERWRVEQKAKAKKNGTYAKKKAESRYTLGDSDDHFTMPYGFARGLEPKEIVGASDDGGKLKFLMKWVDGPQTDIVLAEEANVKCPQIVISYYEKFWGWSDRKPNGYWADEEEFEARRKDATKKISENAHVENGLNKENISSRSGAAIK